MAGKVPKKKANRLRLPTRRSNQPVHSVRKQMQRARPTKPIPPPGACCPPAPQTRHTHHLPTWNRLEDWRTHQKIARGRASCVSSRVRASVMMACVAAAAAAVLMRGGCPTSVPLPIVTLPPWSVARCAGTGFETHRPYRSSHQAFSRFTSSSSSGVKSFLMLKRIRISSGVFPLISSATVLHVRSSSALMSR